MQCSFNLFTFIPLPKSPQSSLHTSLHRIFKLGQIPFKIIKHIRMGYITKCKDNWIRMTVVKSCPERSYHFWAQPNITSEGQESLQHMYPVTQLLRSSWATLLWEGHTVTAAAVLPTCRFASNISHRWPGEQPHCWGDCFNMSSLNDVIDTFWFLNMFINYNITQCLLLSLPCSVPLQLLESSQ